MQRLDGGRGREKKILKEGEGKVSGRYEVTGDSQMGKAQARAATFEQASYK